MREKNELKRNFNYSNKESQKLFKEFVILLGKTTSEIENREGKILRLEEELAKYSSLKYLLKMSFTKIIKHCARIKNKFIPHRS